MPVSRNRKKKNNQKNNCKAKATSLINFNELFNMQLNECRKCEETRDEFAFEELPNEEQRHWENSGVVDQIDYFFHCPNCNQYSAIFKTEES